MSVSMVLMVIALIIFVIAAFNVVSSRINLTALGLAFMAASFIF